MYLATLFWRNTSLRYEILFSDEQIFFFCFTFMLVFDVCSVLDVDQLMTWAQHRRHYIVLGSSPVPCVFSPLARAHILLLRQSVLLWGGSICVRTHLKHPSVMQGATASQPVNYLLCVRVWLPQSNSSVASKEHNEQNPPRSSASYNRLHQPGLPIGRSC